MVGGADADHQMRFLNTAEKFSKETHTWTLIEPMNLARREAAAVMVPLALIDPQEAARRYSHTFDQVLQDHHLSAVLEISFHHATAALFCVTACGGDIVWI